MLMAARGKSPDADYFGAKMPALHLTDIVVSQLKSSPDLSHLVTVKAGDTLPLLCCNIYGSSVYYLEVARVNGLAHFRDLAPGMQLLFPPLQDSAT